MTKRLLYFKMKQGNQGIFILSESVCFFLLFPDNCLGILWKYPYKNRLKKVWLHFGGYLTRLLCESTFERKVKNGWPVEVLSLLLQEHIQSKAH